jgi:hypothetical protein
MVQGANVGILFNRSKPFADDFLAVCYQVITEFRKDPLIHGLSRLAAYFQPDPPVKRRLARPYSPHNIRPALGCSQSGPYAN